MVIVLVCVPQMATSNMISFDCMGSCMIVWSDSQYIPETQRKDLLVKRPQSACRINVRQCVLPDAPEGKTSLDITANHISFPSTDTELILTLEKV